MKIICVDDEELILRLTVSLCRELPHHPEVTGFTKALPALEFLQENQVDIALLDINMPDMDGLTLAARIKETAPDTAIIFLTGYEQYASAITLLIIVIVLVINFTSNKLTGASIENSVGSSSSIRTR